ncbi:hypothetical protein SFRURICE_002013, partial [Spodoptera frugiperda]
CDAKPVGEWTYVALLLRIECCKKRIMSRRLTKYQIDQIIHDFSDSESEGIGDTLQENILEEVGDISDRESIHSEHNSASDIKIKKHYCM